MDFTKIGRWFGGIASVSTVVASALVGDPTLLVTAVGGAALNAAVDTRRGGFVNGIIEGLALAVLHGRNANTGVAIPVGG